MKQHIFFIEKNIRGAWVVGGDIGIRQYYYYTKAEARRKYNDESERRYSTISDKKE